MSNKKETAPNEEVQLTDKEDDEEKQAYSMMNEIEKEMNEIAEQIRQINEETHQVDDSLKKQHEEIDEMKKPEKKKGFFARKKEERKLAKENERLNKEIDEQIDKLTIKEGMSDDDDKKVSKKSEKNKKKKDKKHHRSSKKDKKSDRDNLPEDNYIEEEEEDIEDRINKLVEMTKEIGQNAHDIGEEIQEQLRLAQELYKDMDDQDSKPKKSEKKKYFHKKK